MPTASIDGTTFNYELAGSGPPLVMISGYACDHQYWLPMLDRLAERFTTLVFDNRAVGMTEDDGRPLTAEGMADDTVALARHLGFERARVVGQSMGGSIAQCVAARHTDFVERLALVTTSPLWSRFSYKALESVLHLKRAAVDPDLVADVTMPWLFGETFLHDAEAVKAVKQLGLEHPVRQSEEDLERQLRVLEVFDGRPYLGSIVAPTLILHATEDLVATIHDAQLLQQGIPGAELDEIPCGHAVTAEIPVLLAERLLAFL